MMNDYQTKFFTYEYYGLADLSIILAKKKSQIAQAVMPIFGLIHVMKRIFRNNKYTL